MKIEFGGVLWFNLFFTSLSKLQLLGPNSCGYVLLLTKTGGGWAATFLTARTYLVYKDLGKSSILALT